MSVSILDFTRARLPLLLMAVLVLPACGVSSVKPDKEAVAKMSLHEAKQIIQRTDRWYYADGSSVHEQRALEFDPEHMVEYKYAALSTRSVKRALCPYKSLNGTGIEGPGNYPHNGSHWVVYGCDNNGWNGATCRITGQCMVMYPGDQASTTLAAEAMQRWKASTPAERQQYAVEEKQRFAAVVAQYHQTSSRPEAPEAVRRFQVRAVNAVRDKRYADAINAYEDGLKVAPWWPQGHFNMALLLGQVHYYDEAVEQMQDYLALVPEAANARAAQDQVYRWQDEKAAATPAQ